MVERGRTVLRYVHKAARKRPDSAPCVPPTGTTGDLAPGHTTFMLRFAYCFLIISQGGPGFVFFTRAPYKMGPANGSGGSGSNGGR